MTEHVPTSVGLSWSPATAQAPVAEKVTTRPDDELATSVCDGPKVRRSSGQSNEIVWGALAITRVASTGSATCTASSSSTRTS